MSSRPGTANVAVIEETDENAPEPEPEAAPQSASVTAQVMKVEDRQEEEGVKADVSCCAAWVNYVAFDVMVFV